MSLREVPNCVDFPTLERAVLDRWRDERTFERSLERRAGAPTFVCDDGPPFATGLPHYGHILTTFAKDVVPRYQTMRGFHVPRRWGWDCHGLPVELEAEQALGLRSRADVLALGVERFNAACRDLVMRYQREWEGCVERLGRWVDMKGAYTTMDPDFVESVVWAFHALHQRGLVYEGPKVVPYCARCQTALSNFEARLDDAFRDRDDPALTVRFRLGPRESLLAWTTTPWTLPSNVALAVHPALAYVRWEQDGESVWLADAAAARFAAQLRGWTAVERRRGDALAGRSYAPLFEWFADTPGGFRVLAADFVDAAEGTGVVHLAPAFGEDDVAVCAAAGVVGPNPVRDDGSFDDRVGELAGLHVLAANDVVVARLAAAGALFRRETVRHRYPHCWRCDQPLLYRSIPTWFVQVSAFRDRMVEVNRRVRWVPDHVGRGRFHDWLAGARDWAVSRNRFWGAPVPVWRCAACAATRVVGSRAELERLSGRPLVDWHRPYVDDVVLPCACSGAQRRVPEVLDCWFESGAMPYGQGHYPFEDREGFERRFPADFVVEYVAQTRGWFYTMVALSTALFDEPPFRNAVCHGVILAEDGRKMSKRLKNYPDPMALVDQHGADALRAALLSSGAMSGNDLRFSEASVRDAVRRLHLPLWNALHLYTAYATADGFVPGGEPDRGGRLDRYLLAEAEVLRAAVEAALEGYDFAAAYRALEEFVTTLSTWHLRLAKPALWRPGLDDAKRAAYGALHAALAQLARVAAPLLPMVAEAVHEALGGEGSVHLEDWPAPRPAWRDDALVSEMRTLRRVVHLARRVREQAGVRHRHPLRAAWVAGVPAELLAASRELLEAELNVKRVEPRASADALVRREVVLDYAALGRRLRGRVKEVARAVAEGAYAVDDDGTLRAAGEVVGAAEYRLRTVAEDARGVAVDDGVAVALDLAVDDALVREGLARDLNRAVQDLRKQARLGYDERVVVSVAAGAAVTGAVREHERWLRDQALAERFGAAPLAAPLASALVEVGGEEVTVALARA